MWEGLARAIGAGFAETAKRELQAAGNTRWSLIKMKKMLDKLPEPIKYPEFAKDYQESSQEFTLARERIKARAHAGLSQ